MTIGQCFRHAQRTAAAKITAGGFGLLALLALSACGSWWGDLEEPPLPGERIAVLATDEVLAPDASVADRAIVLPQPYINVAWPEPGGYATHAMYHLVIDADLDLAWSAQIGAGVGDLALPTEPIVADDRVFTMDVSGRISAFDERNGRRLWAYNITPEAEEDSAIGGGLAYGYGILVAATGFAQVIAMRAEDGAVLWRTPVDAPMRAAPSIAAGRVFVLTVDNRTQALDLRTGEKLWSHTAEASVTALLGGANPASDERIVVVPYTTGEVYGLDAGSGRTLWQDSAASLRALDAGSGIADILARPVIDRDMVLAIGTSNRLLALDRSSGDQLWELEIGGANQPWPGGDWLFLLTGNQELIALTRDSGEIRWVRVLPRFEDEEDQEDPISWTGPLLASDRLIVLGSHGEAWSFSPYDGALLGALPLSAPLPIPPVVANGTLYLLDAEGTLLAFR